MRKPVTLMALFLFGLTVVVGCGDKSATQSTEVLPTSKEVKTKVKGGHMVQDEIPTLPADRRKQ